MGFWMRKHTKQSLDPKIKRRGAETQRKTQRGCEKIGTRTISRGFFRAFTTTRPSTNVLGRWGWPGRLGKIEKDAESGRRYDFFTASEGA